LEASDYELVKACINGSQDAFAELVARYKKLVFSVVYNMINDKQEVNDVAQEVFIRIYKSLGRYDPQYKFSTWAVKITTNLCLDTLRKKRIISTPIEEAGEVSSDLDTPEARFIQKEKNLKIREAIALLPEKYRIPIVLFHQNSMSYEEIAKALDEPMTIVKNRLYRARLMLREKLMPVRKEEIL
jgi:RNA polymerase sigma-70 factor (ECF subfamily)